MKLFSIKIGTYYLILSFSIIALILSALLNSRAFTLGYSCSIVFLVFIKFDNKKVRFVIGSVILISIVLAILSCFFKIDSSLGRLLIYKISFKIFCDHWLNGIGMGKFNRVYMLYQASYFQTGNYTQKELLLADNIYTLYNDFFQFIIENGVAGIFLIIFYFLLIFKLIHWLLCNKIHHSFLILIALIQTIVLNVAACFTFIFDRPIFQFIAATSLMILTNQFIRYISTKTQNYYFMHFYRVCCVILFSFFFLARFHEIQHRCVYRGYPFVIRVWL